MEKTFTASHEWVQNKPEGVVIGISNHAATEIGEVLHVALPEAGDRLERDDVLVEIESAKSIHEIPTPLSGTVVGINQALIDDPGLLHRSPEDEGWLIILAADENLDTCGLLSAEAYRGMVASDA